MAIEKSQADAIADALLQPGVARHGELHEKPVVAERKRSTMRFGAWCSLAGVVIGAAVGYFAAFPIARAALIGGISAMLLGRVYTVATA